MFYKHSILMALSIVILLLGVFELFGGQLGYESSPVTGFALVAISCWQLLRNARSNVPTELKPGWNHWLRSERHANMSLIYKE